MHFTLHADGGARGNPGPAGAGVIIRGGVGDIIASISKFLGTRTNNFAEYEALILGFEELMKIVPAAKLAGTDVDVKMDSELVVKQMRGEYKTKNPDLREQKERLEHVISLFHSVTFEHIPREENRDADLLANEAMDLSA